MLLRHIILCRISRGSQIVGLHAKLRLNHQQYFRYMLSVLACMRRIKKSIWKTKLYFGGYDEDSPRSRKERFIFYIRVYLCTDCRRRGAVGFQFCRKANIVARSPELKIPTLSSLPRSAYCALRKVKRIRNEMVKDELKHVRRLYLSLVSRQKAVTSSRN